MTDTRTEPSTVTLGYTAKGPLVQGHTRRVHALDGDLTVCGREAGEITAHDAPAGDVTCWGCRANLHDAGALPLVRRRRS